jgi:hypothetical protein
MKRGSLPLQRTERRRQCGLCHVDVYRKRYVNGQPVCQCQVLAIAIVRQVWVSVSSSPRCAQRWSSSARYTDTLVCSSCWDPDQPQLQLGMYPVDDPQAVRNPRRDTTYITAGVNTAGFNTGGSRDIQWGWNPVGGSRFFDDALTPNNLALSVEVGTVTVQIGV